MGTRHTGYNSLKRCAGNYLISDISEYANNRSLLTFLCQGCDTPIKTTGFLYNKSKDARFCNDCKQRLTVNSPSTRDAFIATCKQIHGDYYDYRHLPETFKSKDNITIVCPKHGEMQITADQHKNKQAGCQHCKIDTITSHTRSNVTDFIIKANTIHNFKYRYDHVVYKNAITHVTITCPKHGNFEQTPDVHLRGSGCKICCNTSRPIKEIIDTLERLQLTYTTEKIYNDCIGVGGNPLRFDIFVPGKNLLIEYDGIHHFQPTKFSYNTTDEQSEELFVKQQTNDQIKDQYCMNNNINFIRIPYTQYHPGAIIQKYLKELTNERYVYTWNDLSNDVHSIINYIKSFNYRHFAIYGISRGGLPFATAVSNHFEDMAEFGVINFQRYDGNNKTVQHQIIHDTKNIPIFVIDDLISSGITMNKAVKSLQHKHKKANIHPIVIFGEENNDQIFFIREHPKQWIVFPYEV